jgi:hypothetical protein
MNNWDNICDYLLYSEECKDIHKMVWKEAGVAYLSGILFVRNGLPYGQRIRITKEFSISDLREIVRGNNRLRINPYSNLN